jgi:ATP-dependent helicase HepA
MALELKYNFDYGTLDLHGQIPSSAKRKVLQVFTYDPKSRCYQAAASVTVLRLADSLGMKIGERDLIAALEACAKQEMGSRPTTQPAREGPAPATDSGDSGVSPGQFVVSLANVYGTGKLVRIEDRLARVAYFDSPFHVEGVEKLVPLDSLSRVELARQTRGYIFDEKMNGWIAGRVVSPLGGEGYVTAFPNCDSRVVREQDLFVRWSVPIQDPTENLAARLSESYLYTQREPFVESMIRQRAACGGMSGLLSSAIELEEHQLQVVRKILLDPIQRYLLADEVGLGKTIEAGIVLRQHLLDSPKSHRALVLAPQILVEQWKRELDQKFFLGAHMTAGSVQVVSYDSCDIVFPDNLTMLVIDEAHRLGALAFSSEGRGFYEAVCRSTAGLDRLLLLSATPVQHNEEAYLAMLHLLDPAAYGKPDEGIALFRAQIQNRQLIADAYDTITSEMPGAFILTAIDSVIAAHPNDVRLKELRDQIRGHCDWNVPLHDPDRVRLVGEVRTHIGECYKLHRRMLRTRRGERTRGLLPGRCGVKVVEYRSAAEERAFRFIDEWRIEACLQGADKQLPTLVRRLYEAAADGPGQLVAESSLCWMTTAQRSRLLAACQDWQNCASKHEAVEELLRTLLSADEMTQILVFAGASEARDSVAAHLSDCLRWKVTTNSLEFVVGGRARVLVCDTASEEGLNLRVERGVIVHYDLPLNANRMEQRLGRMDRYGVGFAVKSYVLLEQQNDFLRNWAQLLAECYKVFDRSIASLQYTIDREANALWKDLAEDGIAAFGKMSHRLGGEEGLVAQELKAVSRQDALDAVEAEHSDEAGLAERIGAADFEQSRDFCVAAGSWLDALGFWKHREPDDLDGRIRRYGYSSAGGGPETLLPLHELQELFGVLDPGAPSPPFSWHRPGTYALTFDRIAAVNRGVRLARLGEPLMDWLYRFSRQDERGTAAIFWRCVQELGVEMPYSLRFCFDVVAEADVKLDAKAGTDTRRRILQRKGDDLLAPRLWRAWVDAQGQAIENSRELETLSIPFRKERAARDFNMNLHRWALAPLDFAAAEWPEICDRARTGALRWITESDDYTTHVATSLARATHRFSINMAQLESRLAWQTNDKRHRLEPQMEQERSDDEIILSGIRNPRLCVTGACAVFLSNVNPFDK